MEPLAVGDRVRMVAPFPGMHPSLRLHLEHGSVATVLRMSVTEGPRRYLVKFDESDAMYGLYWLSPDVLVRVGARHHDWPA